MKFVWVCNIGLSSDMFVFISVVVNLVVGDFGDQHFFTKVVSRQWIAIHQQIHTKSKRFWSGSFVLVPFDNYDASYRIICHRMVFMTKKWKAKYCSMQEKPTYIKHDLLFINFHLDREHTVLFAEATHFLSLTYERQISRWWSHMETSHKSIYVFCWFFWH